MENQRADAGDGNGKEETPTPGGRKDRGKTQPSVKSRPRRKRWKRIPEDQNQGQEKSRETKERHQEVIPPVKWP